MAFARRAVITGMGVVSPLGCELDVFWEALRQGKSGVRRIESFDPSALPVQIAAEVQGFEPKRYLEKKERKRLAIMVRTFQFAVAATQLALDDAKLDKAQLDPARFSVVFGTSVIPDEMNELGPAAR